jgi:hypothetical protein
MNFTLDPSLTSTMRTWIQSALDLCSYPLKDVDIDVTFVKVAEPSTPGHQDTMGTTETGTVATIEIRDGLDDPTHPMNAGLPNPTQDTRFFFMETVIHEMGHVVSFHFIDNDTKRGVAAAAFTKTGETGEGLKTGTLADWNPLDSAWEDRIQEAVAEVFKDTYLADSFRIYENRTHWDVSSGAFNALMTMLLAQHQRPGLQLQRRPGARVQRRDRRQRLLEGLRAGVRGARNLARDEQRRRVPQRPHRLALQGMGGSSGLVRDAADGRPQRPD